MIGRAAEQLAGRQLDIQPLAVAPVHREIEIGDLARGLALGARGLFDLVLARVLVRGHVADIGDVHDVADGVAVELQRAPERIDEQGRAHIAEMLRQIDGRPA